MKQLLRYTVLTLIITSYNQCHAVLFPIQFSIPEAKIVQEIPAKDRDFAFIIPGQINTYIYKAESDYYQDYQRSYFAITCKKGGWDCMRHYEILANGCIPYFVDLEKCDPRIMVFLPRDLIKQAMNLPGVSYLKIDHTKFDKEKYYEILQKLLEHTRAYLTTRAMTRYILDTVHYSGEGKILFLSQDVSPDYLRECVLIGLKETLQSNVIDYPKIDHLYKNYSEDISRLYGRGFTYTRNVEDFAVDRDNIEQRIKNKEFELIVYGSVHRGLPFHDLVCSTYSAEKIVYFCGEDAHQCQYRNLPQMFLREW